MMVNMDEDDDEDSNGDWENYSKDFDDSSCCRNG
jgi:hypothetical protein